MIAAACGVLLIEIPAEETALADDLEAAISAICAQLKWAKPATKKHTSASQRSQSHVFSVICASIRNLVGATLADHAVFKLAKLMGEQPVSTQGKAEQEDAEQQQQPPSPHIRLTQQDVEKFRAVESAQRSPDVPNQERFRVQFSPDTRDNEKVGPRQVIFANITDNLSQNTATGTKGRDATPPTRASSKSRQP
jgi:hypothetical protein